MAPLVPSVLPGLAVGAGPAGGGKEAKSAAGGKKCRGRGPTTTSNTGATTHLFPNGDLPAVFEGWGLTDLDKDRT